MLIGDGAEKFQKQNTAEAFMTSQCDLELACQAHLKVRRVTTSFMVTAKTPGDYKQTIMHSRRILSLNQHQHMCFFFSFFSGMNHT